MSQIQKSHERAKNTKIILQLARLLEERNLITNTERMKLTDLIRKGM